jgi:hypothetical protein
VVYAPADPTASSTPAKIAANSSLAGLDSCGVRYCLSRDLEYGLVGGPGKSFHLLTIPKQDRNATPAAGFYVRAHAVSGVDVVFLIANPSFGEIAFGLSAIAIASLLVAISGRMGLLVSIEHVSNLLLLFFRERLVSPAVLPAISPAVPRREYGASANPDAVIHHLSERFISHAVKHTRAQRLIGLFALILATAAPIRHVVIETTVTPKRTVLQRAIREKAASVARKLIEIGCGFASAGQEYTCKNVRQEKSVHIVSTCSSGHEACQKMQECRRYLQKLTNACRLDDLLLRLLLV